MDIHQSVAYIEDNGTELEIARIRYLLYGQKPDAEVVQPLLKLQNGDGGFPFDRVQGNLSTVDATLYALWWMDELGLLTSPPADRALDYLLAAQREDGGWDEDASAAQYDLPPWIQPGDLPTRLYLSAYAAYWIGVRYGSMHPAFRKALEFLRGHQKDTGYFRGYLHTTWIAAGAFLMAQPQYREVVEKSLQALMNKPLEDWEASQIAWALDCLGRGGLDESHPFVEKSLTELIERNRPDGSWSSEDGEGFAAGATIAALKVLRRFRRL